MKTEGPSVVGALLALLFGLVSSVWAIWYRMRGMEKRGEFRKEKTSGRRDTEPR